MDEELVERDVPTVGERLRSAREEKGLALEDIAAQTRISRRHLESLENSDWEHLPAPTYTVGFAKSYAGSVGLDRNEIGEQLREEMGGQRPLASAPAEVFEPADPARTMPKWLVFGAIAAVILLVVLMSWLNERSLDQPGETNTAEAAAQPAPTAAQPTAPAPTPAAQGPVVLTALAPAWIQVTDGGATLFSGELAPGQSYTVPQNATAPLLKAGKPEALRVMVGTTAAPPVGPAGRVASNVSLLPTDLLRTGQAAAPTATPLPSGVAPATAPRTPARRPKQIAPAAPGPAPAQPSAGPTDTAAPAENVATGE
jgi:cytoskeletal protein RodZ